MSSRALVSGRSSVDVALVHRAQRNDPIRPALASAGMRTGARSRLLGAARIRVSRVDIDVSEADAELSPAVA